MRPWLVAAVALAAAAPAQAALKFSYGDCDGSNFACAHLTVPLDRSGTVPGTIRLYVERGRNADDPQGAVFAISGGPGQGATTLSENFNTDLYGAIGRRDMIVVDQRGTGKSGALDCSALERPGDRPIDVRTAACAQRLGARRAFYTTRASVEDFEAVRAALGIDRITLYGVSYGTKVALAYAQAHPDHVERLVLDSVVPVDGPDPTGLAELASLPRILDELDAGLNADVAALVPAMPVRGPFVDAHGRARTRAVSERALYGTIRAADLDPGARAEYPGAVRAALAGDPAPLVRMEHRFDAVADTPAPASAVQSLSFTLQAATLCEEAPFPWARTATPDERDAAVAQALAAAPDGAFAPFDRAALLTHDSNNLPFQCRSWPTAATAPALEGTPPDVPVLLVAGREDTRTPLENAQRVAAGFPQAQILAVPKTGHAVVGRRRCARVALARFMAGKAVGTPCANAGDAHPPRPTPPRRLSDVAGGAPAAVLLTLDDLARESDLHLIPPYGAGGLRGGFFAQRGRRIVADGYAFVERVALSGRFDVALRRGTFRVRGAVRGDLRLADGRVRGTLGGERVNLAWKRPRP